MDFISSSPSPLVGGTPPSLTPTPPPISMATSTSPAPFSSISPSASENATCSTSTVQELKVQLIELKAKEGECTNSADKADTKANLLKARAVALKDAAKVKDNKAKELRANAKKKREQCAQLEKAVKEKTAIYYDLTAEAEDLVCRISDLEADLKRAEFEDMLMKRYQDPVIRKIAQGLDKSGEMDDLLENFLEGEVSLQEITLFESKLDALSTEPGGDIVQVKSEADFKVKVEERDDARETTRSSGETIDHEAQQISISLKQSGTVDDDSAEEGMDGKVKDVEYETPPTAAEIKQTLSEVRAQLLKLQRQIRPIVGDKRKREEDDEE